MMNAIDKLGSPASGEHDCRAGENAETASLAAYIADMSAELSTLADKSGLKMLAQFLSLARVEAEIRSRELGGFKIARKTSHGQRNKTARREGSSSR